MTDDRFDHRTIDRMARADEVELRVTMGSGAETSRPIWIVVVDGDAYVRSYRGEAGAWYRRVRRGVAAQLGVDGNTLDVRFEPVERGPIDARVSDAYDHKYGARMPGPTQAMLTDEVIATTLHVSPAA
jgi:hypothetical protein